MSILRIRLFGKLQIKCGDQILSDFESRRLQELLLYLLLFRERNHPRETLAGILWPQSTVTQSMKNLRQALWQLQTVLECHAASENGKVLQVDPEWVCLNPAAPIWLDVAEFERTCAHVRGIAGHDLDASQARMIQQTMALYRGDLLEGWYQDWCLFERERLQRLFLDLLEKLMAYCEVHNEYETGLDCGTCALRLDVAHERIHRRIMRLFYKAGNRTAALRQYERCVAVLRKELDIEPSARTKELYERIRSGRPLYTDQVAVERNAQPVEQALVALTQMLRYLQEVQSAMDKTQRQLHHVIRAVQATLKDRD